MGPAGTGPATAADSDVLRRVDDEARERRWSLNTRRRLAAAWHAADDGGDADAHSATLAPERVAAAVADVVAQALREGPAPLVPDPTDARTEDAHDLPVGRRPPSQLGVVQLTGVVARRLLRVGGER
ncbi:hypothetical protein KV097_13390 [Mumia sp. zg.B17]|uniref:hypothetical protein n=1 Tax=unclassified Mumia TaxID=2621872 RepID=UPI001C6E6C74|nr:MULTISPECIES: hypothetical protein [unclassified Mumia]MBW9206937.1 hypothetical protein [Mumia sp. zg.B17]MDD9350507.1 hypothetical protein [Mumia sp.]